MIEEEPYAEYLELDVTDYEQINDLKGLMRDQVVNDDHLPKGENFLEVK